MCNLARGLQCAGQTTQPNMLPPPINPQTLNALKDNAQVYETAQQTIDAHNQLLAALGPGVALTGAMFSASGGATIAVGSISGTVKRGKFTVMMGNQLTSAPTVTLTFPRGTFKTDPFAQLIRNGGTGKADFSYVETAGNITVTISKPTAGEQYGFQFAIAE